MYPHPFLSQEYYISYRDNAQPVTKSVTRFCEKHNSIFLLFVPLTAFFIIP